MEYRVNNSELVLLMLIEGHSGCNGYVIRQLVQERGYDSWSGVSTSSIYVTLKKLEKRDLVTSHADTRKTSKGPVGRQFVLSDVGRKALLSAINETLGSTRAHDPRYNIALCGIDFLSKRQVLAAFEKRELELSDNLEALKIKKGAEHLPLSAKLLFGRIIQGVDAEIRWMRDTRDALKK